MLPPGEAAGVVPNEAEAVDVRFTRLKQRWAGEVVWELHESPVVVVEEASTSNGDGHSSGSKADAETAEVAEVAGAACNCTSVAGWGGAS